MLKYKKCIKRETEKSKYKKIMSGKKHYDIVN